MNKNIINSILRKSFLLLFLTLNISFVKAQMNCKIELAEGITLPVCYGEEISMSVTHRSEYAYQWYKNGNMIVGETSFYLTVEITENNTNFSVKVLDTQTSEEICSDEITITMMNQFTIDFEQTQLTCSNNYAENGQNAKVIATASGEGYVSFTYEWRSNSNENVWTNPGNPQEAIGLKAWKEYYVDVTGLTADGSVCMQRATFTPKAYPNPIVKIVSNPKDTAYIQNPYVTFSFEGNMDSIEHNSWSWAFYNNPDSPDEISETSILQEPTIVYPSKPGKFNVELNIKSKDYGCDTTFSTEMTILPVKLKIPNIFTPNGDGYNDYFIIENDPTGGNDNNDSEGTERGAEYDSYNPLNDYYITTKLTVFNRWGRIVYKSSDYKNDWDGGNLPDGTYFYVIECVGKYEELEGYIGRYQGSVTIFGSGR